MKHLLKTLTILGLILVKNSAALSLDCDQYNNALHQLFQGVYSTSEAMTKQCPSSVQLSTLKIRLLIAKQKTDQATEALNKLIEHHQEVSDVHYFAGMAWSRLARQVNIFSKTSYYKKATQSFILAAQLQPENPLFLLQQAKAYGQPNSLGGAQKKQAGVVAKLTTLNPVFGYLAQMDLAQNKQADKRLQQLANQAVKSYPTNFRIIERAAQAYRTIGDEVQAQKLFSQACNLTPPEGELRASWRFSCYLVSYIAIDETENHQLAIESLIRLIQIYHASTPMNDEIRLLLIEHSIEVNNSALALDALNTVLKYSFDKKIKSKASKAIEEIKILADGQ